MPELVKPRSKPRDPADSASDRNRLAENQRADHQRAAPVAAAASVSKKLSYKERKELEGIPAQIEELEREQAELHAKMAEASFFKQSPAQIVAVQDRLKSLDQTLTTLYHRWEELEGS